MSARRYAIHVPATTANVGPGFDVAGIALSLSLDLQVTVPTSPPHGDYAIPEITYSGLDAENVPLSPYKNLLTRVALYVLRCNDVERFPSGVKIHAQNGIPFGRGLGSSGAAVIAGVLLGDLLGNLKLSKSRLLDFALMVERHPDNVTACLIGGFVGSYLAELSPEDTSASQIPLAEVLPEYPPDAGPEWGTDPPRPPRGIGHYVRFGWAKEIKAVAVMPRFELATAKARGVLPEQYSRKDLVSHAVDHGSHSWVLIRCIGIQPSTTRRAHDGPRAKPTGFGSNLRSNEGQGAPTVPDGARTFLFSSSAHAAHRLHDVDPRLARDPCQSYAANAPGPTRYLSLGRRTDDPGARHGQL